MKHVNYFNCVALEQISKDEWKFKCLDDNKIYSNNLSIALDNPMEITAGTKFRLCELSIDASDLIE